MQRSRCVPPDAFNPVLAWRRAVAGNLLAELRARPLAGGMLGLLTLGAAALLLVTMHAMIVRHAEAASRALATWAPGVWGAIFVLCLAGFVAIVRRDRLEAQAGWLAALPQMPAAMHRWSRWRLLGLALVQTVVLLGLVLVTRRLVPASAPLTLFDCLPALVVPSLACLLAPVAAAQSDWPGRSRTPAAAPAAVRAIAAGPAVLRQWQWTLYRSRCWGPGVRWSLGLVILILPAGASALQLLVALLVALAGLQLVQAWRASLDVIVRAAGFMRALAMRPRVFLRDASTWPLAVAGLFGLAVSAALLGFGMPVAGALVASAMVMGFLTLQLASVLAWRHEAAGVHWRAATVLLLWLLAARALPPLAPLWWAGLAAWLLARASRERT